jgi:TonB-linked SusC/RagA family outer membrane protein
MQIVLKPASYSRQNRQKLLLKTFRIMRITAFLLFITCLQIHAKGIAQKVNLNFKNVPIQKVFKEVSRQTGMSIIYDENFLNDFPPVSIVGRNATVKQVLDNSIKNLPIIYTIENNSIVIKQKTSVTTSFQSANNLLEATDITIKGKVLNEKGEPLQNASVIISGTQIGTTTDKDGRFTLSAPNNKNIELEISSVGYQTKKVKYERQSELNITLELEVTGLSDVVVVGYGTEKKSDLTGSVSVLKADRLLNRPSVNIGEALSGKLPGVEVFSNSGRPNGQISIRIRGDNSITASNEPLYVIDGVIGIADINLVDPNNIQSLQVLKDASATAIYGSRGANGVILITTKRGIKNEKGVIGYNAWVSFGVLAKNQNLKFLNAEEWWQVYNTDFDNIEKYDPIAFSQGKFKRTDPKDLPKLFDANGKPIYNTNWEKEVYGKTAISQNHQLSFRGGSEKTTYSVTLGYLHHNALMIKNYLERYNSHFTIDSKLRNWLKVGANVSLSYNTGNDLYNNYGIKRLAQEALPIIPVKYPDGSWGSNRDFPGAVQDVPLRYLYEMVNQVSNTQIVSDFYLDFNITKNLDFKSTFAVDINDEKNNNYNGKNLIQFGGLNNGGIATINIENQRYWQNENYLTWDKQLDDNNKINLMAGLSWQQRSAELLGATQQNFIDDFYQWHNLGAGTVTQPSSSNDWKWSLNSYFVRANYNLYNKYLFTATGRYDGSSRFGENNKYAFFPSFGFAWRLSQENFLKENHVINDLKIRASIGKTGNQEISNYAYSQNLGSRNVIFGDQYYTALYRSSFGNKDLKWESTTQFDGGIDISLVNRRLEITFDYYHKVTDDLLLNTPIPSTSGLTFVTQNIGSVRNQGFEIGLNSDNITTKNFNWKSFIAFSSNRNKILRLGTNNEDIFPTKHAQGQMKILRVGEPIGSFWGLTRLGTWGVNEAAEAAKYNRLPGDLKYADLNNDGSIDQNDDHIIGNSSPKWTMGISNILNFKNFELLFDFRFVQGNDVMNAGTHNREDRSGVAQGSVTQLDAWTPDNQNTMIAERRYMKTYYDSYPDSHWLQDGSFIRLQNISIGYSFANIGLDKLKIYASAQNLLLITKYNGYDPEVDTFDESSQFGQGIDDFGAPRAKTYTIGVNINF